MICNKNDCIILPYIDHPGPLADAILSREFKSLTVLERDKTVVDAFKVRSRCHYCNPYKKEWCSDETRLIYITPMRL